MREIMKNVLMLLKQNESFVMATVVHQSGSTPRGAGTRMIIRKNKEIIQTIGGGKLEAEVQQIAEEMFQYKKSIVKHFKLNQEEVSQMDMICGGNATVYLQYVDAEVKDYMDIYDAVCKTIQNQKKGWLITLLPSTKQQAIPNQCLIMKNGSVVGELRGDTDFEEIRQFSLRTKKYNIFISNNNEKYMIEPIGHISRAYIYGAGHVSHKLEPLLNNVGFYTVVLDDRKQFANRNRFPHADEVIVLDSFHSISPDITIDKDSYIIIATRGHQHDQMVLEQALKTNAGYIGMIGSKKKRETIYQNLLNKGFTMRDIDRVYSPIGLDIQAETPEEIAVSITAELIQVRAERNNEA